MSDSTPKPKTVWTLDDFRPSEVAEIHGKRYPMIGGKLRILRENFPNARIVVEPAKNLLSTFGLPDEGVVVFKATIEFTPGDSRGRVASAIGTAGKGDFSDSLLEIAETRAIARALRMGGIGVDSTGAEEIQGRRPTRAASVEAEDPPPLAPGDRPAKETLGAIREIRDALKGRGVENLDALPIPSTQEEAMNLLMDLRRIRADFDSKPDKTRGL